MIVVLGACTRQGRTPMREAPRSPNLRPPHLAQGVLDAPKRHAGGEGVVSFVTSGIGSLGGTSPVTYPGPMDPWLERRDAWLPVNHKPPRHVTRRAVRRRGLPLRHGRTMRRAWRIPVDGRRQVGKCDHIRFERAEQRSRTGVVVPRQILIFSK